jgi:hypothetical protein
MKAWEEDRLKCIISLILKAVTLARLLIGTRGLEQTLGVWSRL